MWACGPVLANESLLWDLGWRYQERDICFFFFLIGVLSWFDVGLELLVTSFPLLGKSVSDNDVNTVDSRAYI